jgi:5-methylthioribose kinase
MARPKIKDLQDKIAVLEDEIRIKDDQIAFERQIAIDVGDEIQNVIARGIERNGNYEQEIRELKNKYKEDIAKISKLALTRIHEAEEKTNWLAQTLLMIGSYGGTSYDLIRGIALEVVGELYPTVAEQLEEREKRNAEIS